MIYAENITKSFGALQVLKGITLEIQDGEVVAIVGPSGAGKTTLLQILGTLDHADSGRLTINGTDVGTLPEQKLSAFRNRHIGFVFQFHQLLPEFTAWPTSPRAAWIRRTRKSCTRSSSNYATGWGRPLSS